MNKFISKIIFIVALCVLALALVACAGTSVKGTYYEYNDGVKDENSYITLNKDTWVDDEGETGRLEVKDGVAYGYYTIFGEEEVLFWGTVSDGVFKWTFGITMPTGELIYRNYYSDKSSASNKDSSEYIGGKEPSQQQPSENKTYYTVTFDSCGGTSVAGISAEQGSKLTAPTQPTRTMFVFAGWYKDSRYNNVWDFATDTVEENITLYARWTAEEVRVTSVNGADIDGTDIFMVVSDSVDEVDLTEKVILNNDSATWKLYYDRLGQMEIPTKLAASQSGSFRPGSNLFYIVVTNADSTQSKTYTLDVYKRYEVQVKVMGRGNLLTTYNVMTLDTLPAPGTQRITGYTINGYTSSGASIGGIVPKNSPTTITLTASVTANKYTATLNTNGGNLTSKTKTVTFNSRESLGVPTRTGYSFLGWYVGSTQVTEANGVCAAWTYDADKTLKAEWQINSYKVSVEAVRTDVGVAGSVSILGTDGSGITAVREYSSSVTLMATTYSGFTFDGWYKGSSKVSSEAIYSTTVSGSDATYTAKWKYYTVTTNTNLLGAGFYTSTYRETVGNMVTLTARTNNGYTWLGWFDDYDEKVSEALLYTFTMAAEDVNFTAKWAVCPVTLEKNIADAGTVRGVEGATAIGEDVTVTATTNNGYTWLGWYDGETKVSEGTSLSYIFAMSADNKTITAKWVKISTCKNIEEAGFITELNEKYLLGDEITIIADTNTGYLWQGWYNGNVCLTQELSYTFTMTENVSLYTAKWEKCTAHTTSENCVCTKCGTITGHISVMDEKGYCRHDNYIYFGYYPQTLKADDVTVGDIADSDGYYMGSDGNKYAEVIATKLSGTRFNNTEVISGNTYYFKVEPIKWKILKEKDGTVYLLCDSIITNRRYDENSNNYANSEIRAWLNNEFYNTAFNSLQQELIQITNVDNSAQSTGYSENKYACENTDDKIFLPTYREVGGFGYVASNESRTKIASDFAVGGYAGSASSWWLRSPDPIGGGLYGRYIDSLGGYYSDSRSVVNSARGVVPALILTLNGD